MIKIQDFDIRTKSTKKEESRNTHKINLKLDSEIQTKSTESWILKYKQNQLTEELRNANEINWKLDFEIQTKSTKS